MSVLYRKRRLINYAAFALAWMSMFVGVTFLAMILWTLVQNGWEGLIRSSTWTEMTPPPGQTGGLKNAIVGSLILTLTATALGTPIGILAGTFLSEFGRKSKLASTVRFVNGILLSSPSVVVGFFAYALIVVSTRHFSGWAGIFALCVLFVPVVISSTENMLRMVPNTLREAAAALGAPQWKIVTLVIYRSAKSGLLTGILLAVARISGETAPLLFTVLNNQFWSTTLSKPMPNLPVTVFQFAMSPYEDWMQLAWAGALIITLGVLGLNIFVRIVLRPKLRGSRF